MDPTVPKSTLEEEEVAAAAATASTDDRSTCEKGLVSSSILTAALLVPPLPSSAEDERSCDEVKVLLECLGAAELELDSSSILTREMSTLGT